MVLDSRVKVYGSSIFRPQLSMEDIVFGYGEKVELFSSNDSLSKDEVQFSETALVFLDKPIVVPNTSYRYSNKFYKLNDEYIERCVKDLMFINPNLDGVGINKMTSWIVSFLVGTNKENVKVLNYEDLLPIVAKFSEKYSGGGIDIIEDDKIVFYKMTSLLKKKDKRWYSNHYRHKRDAGLKGELIHSTALMASRTIHLKRKITKSLILSYIENIKAMRILNKYIEPRTIRFLEDENSRRYFKTDESLMKFLIFSETYNEDYTLDFYTRELNISKTTAMEYRNILIGKK